MLKPKRQLRFRAINIAEIEKLIPEWRKNLAEHVIGHQMDVGAGCGNGAEHTGFVTFGRVGEDSAHQHFALMSILSLADCVHFAALPNETPHRGILMPDIAELHLCDLPKSVVSGAVLQKRQNCKLTYELSPDSDSHDVKRKLRCSRWRSNYADSFSRREDFVEFCMCTHSSGSAFRAVTVHAVEDFIQAAGVRGGDA